MKESYWKRGSKEDAERIREAFRDLGACTCADYTQEDILYVLDGICGTLFMLPYESQTAEAIMDSHMFNELTLKVEPKFEVGDWVVFNNSHNSIYQISEIRDSYYMLTHIHGGSMSLSFSQWKLIRPWTIGDAKDGDILTDGKKIVLFNKLEEPAYKQHIIAYIGLDLCGRLQITEDTWRLGVDKAMPATKEQRDLLFAKMLEAGYLWDDKKKELRKIIKPKFKVGTMIRWANPQTREENWHMVIGVDNNKRVYRTKTWKSKDYEIPFEKERFYEVLPAPKPMFEYNELVFRDDLLGRITESKYKDGMWLYRVGSSNTWNFDKELMRVTNVRIKDILDIDTNLERREE